MDLFELPAVDFIEFFGRTKAEGLLLTQPYAYPVVNVRELHLWPVERPPVQWNWWNVPYYSPYNVSPQPFRQGPPPR